MGKRVLILVPGGLYQWQEDPEKRPSAEEKRLEKVYGLAGY